MNDVILNKITTIERCVNRIHEVYEGNPENLKDFTKQDSIILNIQRACEASIDLAMHIVSERKLGVPKASREGFKLLQEAHIIDSSLAKTLMNMVGFRNIAVHYYQALKVDILEAILDKHIDDFKQFTKVVLQLEI
ncbi:type VII toxin-antitoxin system HepT family RNase toxin [Kurthia gibsonii]|uniref:type VII toxin-antitoxin system HepT family RNase toxin n=1 Tax=Kurthia gibsonii TaxID=33946 RepID=UPI003018CB07